jgi:hypothetical protein
MNYCITWIKKVVADVGKNNVVRVIINNGSNYKKAYRYLTNEYLHIACQPCLAHIINLMLKTIGEFSIMNLSLIVQSSLQDGCITM